jgi:hypothetical protein
VPRIGPSSGAVCDPGVLSALVTLLILEKHPGFSHSRHACLIASASATDRAGSSVHLNTNEVQASNRPLYQRSDFDRYSLNPYKTLPATGRHAG